MALTQHTSLALTQGRHHSLYRGAEGHLSGAAGSLPKEPRGDHGSNNTQCCWSRYTPSLNRLHNSDPTVHAARQPRASRSTRTLAANLQQLATLRAPAMYRLALATPRTQAVPRRASAPPTTPAVPRRALAPPRTAAVQRRALAPQERTPAVQQHILTILRTPAALRRTLAPPTAPAVPRRAPTPSRTPAVPQHALTPPRTQAVARRTLLPLGSGHATAIGGGRVARSATHLTHKATHEHDVRRHSAVFLLDEDDEYAYTLTHSRTAGSSSRGIDATARRAALRAHEAALLAARVRAQWQTMASHVSARGVARSFDAAAGDHGGVRRSLGACACGRGGCSGVRRAHVMGLTDAAHAIRFLVAQTLVRFGSPTTLSVVAYVPYDTTLDTGRQSV
jgi:hypothetical protein